MTRSHGVAFSVRGQNGTKGVSAPLILASEPMTTSSGIKTPLRAHIAQRCLKLLDPKMVASQFNVSVRTVQKWISGEAAIPDDRTNNIIVQAKTYFLTDLNQLEDAIDRMLINQYGPHTRGSM